MSATATASGCVVETNQNHWLGIDFSGDKRRSSPRCLKSNVWIAEIRPINDVIRLVALRRVQELQGTSDPFGRLASHLSRTEHQLPRPGKSASSVPNEFLPQGGHRALLDVVANLLLNKTFPDAHTFADSVIMGRPMAVLKALRKTEKTEAGTRH